MISVNGKLGRWAMIPKLPISRFSSHGRCGCLRADAAR
jgi:hypothetical protein